MTSDTQPSSVFKLAATSLVFLSCCLAYQIRFGSLFMPQGYLTVALTLTLLSLCLLSINGYYIKTKQQSLIALFIESIKVLVISSILVSALLYLTKSGATFSRIWFVYSVLLSSFSITLLRYLMKVFREKAYLEKNVLIIGRDDDRNETLASIDEGKLSHLSIDNTFSATRFEMATDLPKVIDHIESVRNTESAISEIWITADIYREHSPMILESAFSGSSVTLAYIPVLPDIDSEIQIEKIGGIPTINSGLSSPNRLKLIAKRCEDLVLSIAAIVVLSPLLVLIPIAIKLDSKGPIFYRQSRYGINGREISVWKFRTMFVTEAASEFKQATSNDPRITRVGRFLRRSSLDELPQLLNVLNGSMSIVGPRPHPNLLNEEFRPLVESYMRRHNVKPGITGLAQANGARGETETLEKMTTRVNFDLEYVKNWSLLLDLKIIVRTFFEVFRKSS